MLVKMKNGSLHMCLDCRGLNRITKKESNPLPRFDELIGRFRGARYSNLDLLSGYHQQQIAEEDTHKTAFRYCYGHSSLLLIPLG